MLLIKRQPRSVVGAKNCIVSIMVLTTVQTRRGIQFNSIQSNYSKNLIQNSLTFLGTAHIEFCASFQYKPLYQTCNIYKHTFSNVTFFVKLVLTFCQEYYPAPIYIVYRRHAKRTLSIHPPLPGIARVEALTLLGVILDSHLVTYAGGHWSPPAHDLLLLSRGILQWIRGCGPINSDTEARYTLFYVNQTPTSFQEVDSERKEQANL